MIIALFANMHKLSSHEIALDVCKFLKEKGVHVRAVDEEEAYFLKIPKLLSGEKVELMISMGGDGSLLRAYHQFSHLDLPLLGVNLGSLGFLADIPREDLYSSLEDLSERKYHIEKRVMMEGSSQGSGHYLAVNDMVIHRGKNPSLVDLAVRVDGKYLNTFSADGLIIATPTGSTAYSLAAGGPILTPELEAFVLTPICAHTISNCPIVLMPKQGIEIEYLSRAEPVEITYDGMWAEQLPTNGIFTITPSKRSFKMVNLWRTDYYSTLRTKLGWAGGVRGRQLTV